VTLIAAELLKEIKQNVEEGVNPQVIIKGFRRASVLVSGVYFM
jgi:T-complex protein 1 subunit eta